MSGRYALLVIVTALAAYTAAGPAAAPVRTPAQLADAVLPPGVNLNWDKGSIQPLNAKRAQVSLDGIWRFTPAAGGPPPV